MRKPSYTAESVQARWLGPGDMNDVELFIDAPSVARFTALFTRQDTGLHVEFGDLRVDKCHRTSGLATRLVSALAYLAIDRGAQTFSGSIDSQHSLKILSHILDERVITFSDIDPKTKERLELPITLDGAIASLERAEAFEVDTEYREKSLIVHAALSAIDPSKLEAPVELNSPITSLVS